MTRDFKRALSTGGSVMTLLIAAPAFGQAQPIAGTDTAPRQPTGTSSGAQEPSVGVADIVVTAQKRSESINKVPLSITAASGDQLARASVVDTKDLAKIAPGFTYADTQLGNPVYTLRGIGFYDQGLSSTPAVSVYNDEVPLTYPAETRGAILDLERVEILKGPQGTLFGQNATGGAINYIAAKPTGKPSFGFDLGYSRFNQFDVGGFASGPITDTLSVRVAVHTTQSSEGWQRSYTRDDTLGRMHKTLFRAIADWRPSDRLTVRLNFNGWVDKSETQAAQLVGLLPQVPALLPPGYANYPFAPKDDRAADWNDDPYGRPARDERFFQTSLRADYKITDEVTVTSLTSFDHLRGSSVYDTDGIDKHAYDYVNNIKIDSQFQELRISGKADRFNWILGGNYKHDKTNQVSPFLPGYSSLSVPAPGIIIDEAGTRSKTESNTYGIFGNAEYHVLDNLTVQGGLRYNHDTRRGATCGFVGPDNGFGALFETLSNELSGGLSNPTVGALDCYTLGPAPTYLPGLVQQRLTEHNLSWRTALTWNVARDVLLYTNVSKGYKSGGLPAISATVIASLQPYKQESVISYEAGFKATLANRRLQLNGAAFYYNYHNKQILGNYLDPVFAIQPIIVNIPKSRIWGLEGQLITRPVNGLNISAAATYLNSKILKYSGYDTLGNFGDQAGTKIPFTPQFTAAADVEYEFNLSSSLKGFIGGGLTYNSRTNAGIGDLKLLAIDSYALADVRAGVRTQNGRISLTAFGNNITNKYYWTTVLHVQDGIVRYSGRPAVYGIRIAYRY